MPLEDPASKRGNGGGVAPLKATLAKLEVALGATRDAIAWTDERGRIEWCNAPFDRFAGKRHMDMIGASIFDALPLERWTPSPRAHPAKEVLARRSFVNETLEIARDGKTSYLDFFGSWAQGGGIGPIAVFVLRDVSRRVRREEQLKRATAILEAQQEATLDGILIVDERGRILKYNNRFTQLWKIPEDVLATASDEKALQAVVDRVVDPKGFLDRVRDLYDDREATAHEEIALKDGTLFDRYTAPILGPDKTYYGRAWYFRDVTSRRRAERQLEEKSRELTRSNAELQQFASAASHDLMEPLRKIAAFGDLLRRQAGDRIDDKGREFLDRIQSAAVRMGALIQDLLQYSRVYGDARPFELVELDEIARGVVADLERAIREAGATVVIGPLPKLYAHPFQMRQLLQNLIANAVKFRRPDVPPRIAVERCEAPDGFICFSVSDNGIGFEDKFSEKIFEPFLRLHTRSEYEGTGLGLAICRRIATRHSGTVSARPSPGGGAVFAVTLPGGRP
jgi:PAS domain S-box-containing protein